MSDLEGPEILRIGTLGAARITPKALLAPAREAAFCRVDVVAARDASRADDFAKKHEEEKLIPIVQKTWKKMTDKAHAAALELDYAPEDLEIIQKALKA